MIKKQFFILSLAVIFTLLAVAINPTAAYADEQPPTDVPTETAPTDETEGGADDSGTSDTGEGEATEEQSSGSETTENSEGDSTGSSDEPILEQVPENTSVVVINEDGESEPLATQDAANAIATSDPIWCPVGQPPIPGENGCTGTFASFDELLTFLKANEGDAAYQQAGIIYVAMGNYETSETSIDFNEYGFNELVNYDLTIQGGWNTTTNTTDPAESTTFNISITIGTSDNPWVGSLIFNNINIEDLIEEDALTAYSQEDITLTNVEITNIEGGTAATLTSTAGDVTITNGTFSESENGAVITAGGDVTIQGAQFDGNDIAGAAITAGGDVDVSDSTFNNNGKGLEIVSTGSATLSSVQANENAKFGADIVSEGSAFISKSFFTGNQSYTSYYCGSGQPNGYGLKVVSQEAISLDQVDASYNFLFGAYLEAAGQVNVADSFFNENGSSSKKYQDGKGLEIKSGDIVTLANVQANGNRLFGANIDAVGDVQITGSEFSFNQAYTCTSCGNKDYYGYGLKVLSQASIYLDDVEAAYNNLFGAYLEAASNVQVLNSAFDENGSASKKLLDGKGLEVKSGANVTLANVQAIGNHLYGASISALGNVDVSDSFFNNNGVIGYKTIAGKGLEVTSGGDVTLKNVQANENYEFGANISAEGGVSISNSFFSGNQAYTSSYCGGSKYSGYGLKVIAKDAILLDQVDASYNFLFGAYLESGTKVEVLDSFFDENGSSSKKSRDGKGLEIKSGGDVTLTNVEAYGNRLFGADINATGDVQIKNSIFSGNQAYTCSYCGDKKYYGYGLQVISLKNISLDGVTATENNLFGAYLDAAGSVSIANSVFSFNGSDSEIVDGKGLEIKSGGYVSLFNVEASENRLFGANITATKSVAIYQGFFSGNNAYTWSPCEGDQFYGYGLQIVSLDDISLDEVTATYNFLWGANLDAAGNVAISNSVFNFNSTETPIFIDDTGLIVKSGKNVALSNVEANYNRLAGADIYAVGDVSIRNSTFTGNMGYTTNYCNCGTYHGYGLKVVSLGSIALDGVTANDNYLFGAYLDAAADVAIMDSFFNNNGSPSSKNIDGRGLEVKSGGYVSLYKVEANNNREFGANITAAKSVAISSSFFSGNMGYTSSYCGGKTYYGYGLQVVSSDVITLDGVTANDNYLFGANLESAVDINVFNSTFNNNGSPSTKKIEGKGLTVKSGGNVTLNNVQANNNRLFGADIQATGAVTITNSFFSGNQAYTGSYCSKKYYGYGLQVVTLGNIRLENVTANDNNLFGAKLKTEGNVEVVNSFFDSNGTSTSGKNAQGNGLVITGNNVTLENVQANGNRLSGATIEATGSVGITNSNFSFNKYGSGLSVTSGGEITLTNVTATDNGQNGAYLKGNCSNINVIDGTYSNNGEYGLEVVNGMLVISGAPIFADNGAGNIFEDPGTCFITTTAIVPTTTATTSTVASSYIVTPPSHSVNYRFPFRYNNVLSKRYWTFSFGLNHREWLLHYWI